MSQQHRKTRIVHGDIKPENVVVSTHPGSLLLIDFGSAWSAETAAVRDAGDGISAAYAAPELQNGHSFADFRSDQFSLSVILYQLLTLEIPYNHLGGKAGRPEFVARMAAKLVPPSQRSPYRNRVPQAVWRRIDSVTMRGLALNADQRYPTPRDWLDALDAVNVDIQRPTTISPLNDCFTRLVAWLFGRFRRT